MNDPYAEIKTVRESDRKTKTNMRCANPDCGKLLAELITSPWKIKCYRCKAENHSG